MSTPTRAGRPVSRRCRDSTTGRGPAPADVVPGSAGSLSPPGDLRIQGPATAPVAKRRSLRWVTHALVTTCEGRRRKCQHGGRYTSGWMALRQACQGDSGRLEQGSGRRPWQPRPWGRRFGRRSPPSSPVAQFSSISAAAAGRTPQVTRTPPARAFEILVRGGRIRPPLPPANRSDLTSTLAVRLGRRSWARPATWPWSCPPTPGPGRGNVAASLRPPQ
jgi:hypothetical protein